MGNYPLQVPENTDLLTLSPNDPLEIEPGFTISLIGESTERTSYLLQYHEVSILIPAGVDYAVIRDEHPEAMRQPAILVLTPEDVSYIPPRLWEELEPESILWNSLEVTPFSTSVYPVENERTEIISDGVTILEKTSK